MSDARRLAAQRRRRVLHMWMSDRPEHRGLTATVIANESGIYYGHGRADRCFDDLVALARQGVVSRDGSRPARWTTPPHREPSA